MVAAVGWGRALRRHDRAGFGFAAWIPNGVAECGLIGIALSGGSTH